MGRKRKIGILTHPLHSNYGGILQAWAMQEVLRRRGFEVETFAVYSPKPSYVQELIAAAKRAILKVLHRCDLPVFYEYSLRRQYRRINHNILRFIRKNIKLRDIESIKHIPSKFYDTVLVGSDQVWRDIYVKRISGSDDSADAFLYNFKDECRRIAYAASFGIDVWSFTKEETVRIREALSRFSAISVREISGVSLLTDNVGCTAQCVLDPTMLLNSDDYLQLISNKSRRESGHGVKLVTYILDPSSEKEMLISRVLQAHNLSRVELNEIDESSVKISIEDWLYAMSSANIVVTDSFHGCIFSIIFGKPLIFIMNSERGNARFDSLIKMFGLENNLVATFKEFDIHKDYSLPNDIEEKLFNYRQISHQFIDNALILRTTCRTKKQ